MATEWRQVRLTNLEAIVAHTIIKVDLICISVPLCPHLSITMPSIVRRIKQNKIGAVVFSVFDWYRESRKLYDDSTLMLLASHYPAEERKLLRKLDLAILIFGCLSCKF